MTEIQAFGGPRTTRGEAARREILELAVDIASAEGLEGLTIGRLAQELGRSKSGLFAHFGSKVELQLATVHAAAAIFRREIVEPVVDAEPGLGRLAAMLESWTDHIERSVFRGGCFFAAASAEFDGRPGAVRDLVASLTRQWLELLEREAVLARRLGQLRRGIDGRQLAFEVHAFVQEANWAYQLFGDRDAFGRARVGIRDRLERSATAAGAREVKTRPAARQDSRKRRKDHGR